MPAPLSFVQIRSAKQHRKALVLDELQDNCPQFAPGKRINTDRGFIEKQEFRRANKGASEAELLLHAARQPAGLPLDKRAERRHFHQSRIAVTPLVGSDSMQIGVEVEIFLDAEILVQPEFLGHIANERLDLLRIGGNVDAQDTQIAGIRGHQTGAQTHERGLPGSIRSDQRGQRAAPRLEGHAIKRLRGYAFITGEGLMDFIAGNGIRRQRGRTHCWTLAMAAMPEEYSGLLPSVDRYALAGDRRYKSDPPVEPSIREAVERDRRGHSRSQLADIRLCDIGSYPFRISDRQREYWLLRRRHLPRLHKSCTDDGIHRGDELGIRELLAQESRLRLVGP